ncbi:MAG: 30S ribosomal protein S16, partial [Candidatus Marinimicrobia bacterium]|nr:30S ribosomal protein S16 [Candidatus Neomarinimicrobiota bacterium]
MAVRIRLKKLGRKKRPFYRVVAIDSKFKRDGREIERLGWYDPVQDNNPCSLNEDRVLYWLNQGAKPSDTVQGLFRKNGLSYKWHLVKQGLKEAAIEKLLEEWKEREKNRFELKKEKKIKKKELSSSLDSESTEAAPAEEAPAEEAKAEEAPAEEAKAEEAPAEEAPAEEAKAEEAPAEEAKAEEAPAEEAK